MKRFLFCVLPVTVLVMLTGWLLADEPPPPSAPPPAPSASKGQPSPDLRAVEGGDIQDFVLLAEARPLLVRLHVRVDGKPLPDSWNDFMKYLFAYLDVNGDGVLNEQEAASMPKPEQLSLGGIILFAGGPAKETMKELDANKDGKATLDELKAYCLKKKFTPFQFQLDMNAADPLAQVGFLGGYRPEPEVAVVSKAIFDLLDANKDGKVTRDELSAAQPVLLARDENEDETVTTKEIVPDAKPQGGMMGAMAMRARAGNTGSAGNQYLVPITARGEAPPELARFMQERYDPSAKKPFAKLTPMPPPAPTPTEAPPARSASNGAEKTKQTKKESQCKLTREQLGLDKATFDRLDANNDGVLDNKEVAAFVKREPDLCLIVSFGDKVGKSLDMAVGTGQSPLLAGKVAYQQNNLVLFDFDKTRMELRRDEGERKKNVFADILRSQLSELFKAADKNGNGYVDEKEAKDSPQFRNIFKTLDRDGDGKVSNKEMLAYFDKMQEIQKRARAACVTLVLRDQSRGLFELLDTNRDGWLGLRELRQAPRLLERASARGKDYLTMSDMPHSYLLTVRRGTSQSGDLAAQEAVFDRLYGFSDYAEAVVGRGPAWFRKMDKNHDGDVSRKEFLFSDELFHKIDADGDGLISVEEAERAGEVARREN